jgi:hypothetical protein
MRLDHRKRARTSLTGTQRYVDQHSVHLDSKANVTQLTYLLQYSLGGNSKTLMFVMVSPLQAHLQETITSLKFATKVHNTHIGTAKKQTKTMVKD